MRDTAIPGYYDRLSRWNAVARLVGYGGGRDSLTVHRPLADPRVGDRPTTSRVHDIIVQELGPVSYTLALDAGCGLGGTMLELSERLSCRFVGLTLSQAQAQTASRAIRDRNSDRVQVLVQNYDSPPPGPYGLVVAIESLAHSEDPERSVVALASVLAPGGTLVVVDDMPEADAGRSPDLQLFRDGWQCPRPLSYDAYRELFARVNLSVAADRDLTADTRPRDAHMIARLMMWNRFVARVAPSRGLRAVMDSHLGGLALERLTREGLVRYRLLIARRPRPFE